MTNAEYVRALLLQCPDISKDSPDMMIDFLDNAALSYSIEGEPTGQIVKAYIGGDTLRRYSFALVARRNAIIDADRAANNGNYEKLSLWLEEMSRRHMLPPMDEGMTPRRIYPTGAPYLHERDESGDTATYIMQIEHLYDQKARNTI